MCNHDHAEPNGLQMTSIETRPTQQPQIAPPPGLSKWPKVIGVMSLLYALGGLLCQTGMGAMGVFGDMLMRLGGSDMTMPIAVKIINGTLAVAGLGVGIYMLIGSIALLRRLRSGVSILRNWAVARLVLLLVVCVAAVINAPTNIAFQKAGVEMRNAQALEADMKDRVRPVPGDDELHRQLMIQTGVFAGVLSVYPMILGFYLSRRNVTDEVADWV